MVEHREEERPFFTPKEGKALPSCPGFVLVERLDAQAAGLTETWRARNGGTSRVFKLGSNRGDAESVEQCVEALRKEVEFRDRLRGRAVHFVDHNGKELENSFAPFVAFEDYRLGSLAKALFPDHPLAHLMDAEAVRLEIVAAAAEAIASFHEAGIYHGDARSANLLLRIEEEEDRERIIPYWTDFGRAGLIRDQMSAATAPTEIGWATSGEGLTPRDRLVPVGLELSEAPPAMEIEFYSRNRGESPQRDSTSSSETPHRRCPEEDVRCLAVLLYQVAVNDPGSRGELHEGWRDKVECEVLRELISEFAHQDTRRRPGGARELARRIRAVGETRARRAARKWKRRWMLAAGVSAVLALLLVLATWAWLAEAHSRSVENEIAQFRDEFQTHELEQAQERQRIAEEAFAQELILAGDTASRLGAPEEARGKYREALHRPNLDPAAKLLLRARIARMSAALDDVTAVKYELDAIEREPNLPSNVAALFRLEKAMYLLERSMQLSFSGAIPAAKTNTHEKETETLLRQAAQDMALPQADRLTARGILAGSAESAMSFFQQATEAEPFNPYANLYFASTALLAGRLPEALPRLELWLRMSPKNPAPVLYKAIALTLLGKRADADRAMRELDGGLHARRPIGPRTLHSYKIALDMLWAIHTTLAETPMDTRAIVGVVFQLMAISQRSSPPAAPGEDTTGIFRAPLTPAQRRSWGRFLAALQTGQGISFAPGASFRLAAPDPAAALKQLEDGGSFVPEGLRLYFRASLKLHPKIKDKASAVKDLERAAELPALFPVRRSCLLGLASHQIGLAKKNPAGEQLLAKARELLHQADRLGPMNTQLQEIYLDLVIRSGDLTFAGDRAASWHNRKALQRIEALRARPD